MTVRIKPSAFLVEPSGEARKRARAQSKGAIYKVKGIYRNLVPPQKPQQIFALKEVRREIPDAIVLNDTDRDRLLRSIENPPAPSEALLTLATKLGYR